MYDMCGPFLCMNRISMCWAWDPIQVLGRQEWAAHPDSTFIGGEKIHNLLPWGLIKENLGAGETLPFSILGTHHG